MTGRSAEPIVETSAGPSASLRILCVEDNDLDVERVRRLAARLDASLRVERDSDGDEALERLGREAAAGEALPDLVLLDLNLPRLNGHECLRAIRANPALDALAVVILTTSMRESDRATALGAGAADYLVKPLSREAFAGLLAGLGRAPSDGPATGTAVPVVSHRS